jgi:hypothetical protein
VEPPASVRAANVTDFYARLTSGLRIVASLSGRLLGPAHALAGKGLLVAAPPVGGLIFGKEMA